MTKEELKIFLNTFSEEQLAYVVAIVKSYENLEEENKELSRMCELYSKSLYNAELKQLQQEKENLIKYLENEINEIKGTGLDNGSYDEYLSGRLDSNEAILEKVKSGEYE